MLRSILFFFSTVWVFPMLPEMCNQIAIFESNNQIHCDIDRKEHGMVKIKC